jgi:hypothetical protein
MRQATQILILLLVGAGAAQLAEHEETTRMPEITTPERAGADAAGASMAPGKTWASTEPLKPAGAMVRIHRMTAPEPKCTAAPSSVQAGRFICVVPAVALRGLEPCS